MNPMNYLLEKGNELCCYLVCALGECLAHMAIMPFGCPVGMFYEPEIPEEMLKEFANRH